MKKSIVITSINLPTRAVSLFREYSDSKNIDMYVIGDVKTSNEWCHQNVYFKSVDQQLSDHKKFANLLPMGHYSRKNLGYIYSYLDGVETILDTDDDNLPYPNWSFDLRTTLGTKIIRGDKYSNVYKFFTEKLIWPRGLPLDYVHCSSYVDKEVDVEAPIRQGLANDDPDVDAIYRLLYKSPVQFNHSQYSYVCEHGTYVPFNSQNTYFDRKYFPLMYLPSNVTFRMTDIWRSFIAQRICRENDVYVSFSNADVYQERNAHDLMSDFNSEVIGYQQNKSICETLDRVDISNMSINDSLLKCYEALVDGKFITANELKILDAWIEYFS